MLCITANSGHPCPLWVKSRHDTLKSPCPLCPQKRTSMGATGMSALCQKPTSRFSPRGDRSQCGEVAKLFRGSRSQISGIDSSARRALGEGQKSESARGKARDRRGLGSHLKAGALTCRGASDNKGRSRVTIAPTKEDQMYLAAGHFRAASIARSNRAVGRRNYS
jgi:hypothetical protein